jgi:predicted MFS family arabinose efflux permease
MGSIFSGVAAHLFSWRASLWLLAMIYISFFIASIWTVPKTQASIEKMSWDVLRRFDVFGILLSIAGIALFCASLT